MGNWSIQSLGIKVYRLYIIKILLKYVTVKL